MVVLLITNYSNTTLSTAPPSWVAIELFIHCSKALSVNTSDRISRRGTWVFFQPFQLNSIEPVSCSLRLFIRVDSLKLTTPVRSHLQSNFYLKVFEWIKSVNSSFILSRKDLGNLDLLKKYLYLYWYLYRESQNSMSRYTGLDIRTTMLWIWCEWDAAIWSGLVKTQLLRSKQLIH